MSLTSILLNIVLILALVYNIVDNNASTKTSIRTNVVIAAYKEKIATFDNKKSGYDGMVTYTKARAFDAILNP